MSPNDSMQQDLHSLRIAPEQRARGRAAGRRRWPLIAGAVLVFLVLLGAVSRWRGSAVAVEVVQAERSSGPAATAALIASGYVVPHHKVEVGSKVMGKVAWIGVEKGDRVKAGQLLVRLEDDEYRAQVEQARGALALARARLAELEAGSRPEEIARARADRDNAKANYDRVLGLAGQGIYSPQQLDDARSRYEMAEKTYELARIGPRKEEIQQARAGVSQAEGALAYAEAQLEATRIRAPVSGTILERLVEKGEMVTTMFAGERGAKSFVVSLADLGDIRVELDINQNDFPRVFSRQPCDVVLEAYPDSHYRGEVVEIAPEANREKGTVQVKVQILRPDEKVRPEMIARVAFEPREKPVASGPVITIPRSAVVNRNGHSAVFLVEGDRARLRSIRGTEVAGQRMAVNEGLQGGEQVVVTGQDVLQDGARVTVRESPRS